MLIYSNKLSIAYSNIIYYKYTVKILSVYLSQGYILLRSGAP